MVYQWAPGARFSIPAQVAGERLAELAARQGDSLTPMAVVDDARPADAPLHGAFEWDDATAAERHREEQARRLIRSVRVVHVAEDGEAQPIQGWVHATVDDVGPAYVTTARAMSEDELREQVVAEALAGLHAWRRRYEHLAELAPLLAAIERQMVRPARPARRRQPQPVANH